jgi:hypothetical protein
MITLKIRAQAAIGPQNNPLKGHFQIGEAHLSCTAIPKGNALFHIRPALRQIERLDHLHTAENASNNNPPRLGME